MTTLKKNSCGLVTISPLTSCCTACAASFYEFKLHDQYTLTEISHLFCELFEIEATDIRRKLRLSQKTQLRLPFCPQCLLSLNEIRQMSRQLRNLEEELSKLKDSLILAVSNKINQCGLSDNDVGSNEPGSSSTQTNVRFIHEHIKTRCNVKILDRRGSFPQDGSPRFLRYMYRQYDDEGDVDDDGSGSDEFPLMVDIVEDVPPNNSEHARQDGDMDVFDPLSSDNTDPANHASGEDSLSQEGFISQGNGLDDTNGEKRMFSGVRLAPSIQMKKNGVRSTNDENQISSNGAIISEQEDCEPSDEPRSKRRKTPGFSIRIVPPQELQNSPLPDDISAMDEDSLLETSLLALGNQPIEIDFDDPRAQIRENFTMCPICFKYTLREGAESEGHSCEQKSQTAHFQCGYCDVIAHTEKSLVTHMKQHLSKDAQRKILTADSAHARLLEVFAAVSGPYPCPYCDSVFSRKSELIRGHIASQHGVRLKPYPCSVCGNAFRSKNDLERHFRTHTGERPFSCPGCAKTFTRRHHLTTHETSCKYQKLSNSTLLTFASD